MDVQKCELEGQTVTSGHAMSGPARIDSHCDHLDDSFLGSNEDLKCFAAKFEAINKEVKA